MTNEEVLMEVKNNLQKQMDHMTFDFIERTDANQYQANIRKGLTSLIESYMDSSKVRVNAEDHIIEIAADIDLKILSVLPMVNPSVEAPSNQVWVVRIIDGEVIGTVTFGEKSKSSMTSIGLGVVANFKAIEPMSYISIDIDLNNK